MKILWICVLGCILSSCAPQQMKMDLIFADQEAMPMIEESMVEVAVLPRDLVFLDLSRWGKPESQLLPRDRLMDNIDQLIERERRERTGDEASEREAELLRLKGAVTTGLSQSDAAERFADVFLEMEETAQEGATQRELLRQRMDDPREGKEAILNYYIMQLLQAQPGAVDDGQVDVGDDSQAVLRLVEELCDKIEEEAWRQAFKNLLHGFVMQNIVLQPASRFEHGEIFHEGSQLTGYCQPVRDDFSGKFLHNVQFEALLLPLQRFVGVIDILHDDQTMGGMGSRAYVTLTDPTQLQAPLPAVIVQHQKGLKPGFVKVVGSGVITQIFGAQGQMDILESTKEIVAGDMFFVLQVRGRLIQDKGSEAPYSPGIWRGMPVETVRPTTE